MLKKFLKTALVASGLVTGATSAQAASVQNAQLTLGSTGKITAIAEDGHTYSKLESTDLNFNGSVHVTMSTGKVSGLAIYNGACGALCPDGVGYHQLFKDVSSFNNTMNLDMDISFDVSADDYPQGLTQNLEASKIFQACHDRMGRSVIGSDVTITHLMKVTLSLELAGALPGTGVGNPWEFEPEWWDDFTVPVQVTCKALDQPQMPGGIVQEEGEFKTTDIDLFLTTFAGETTQPNPATTCKKGRVLVRVSTSKAGPAKFKLWTRVGNGPMTSKVVDAWSSFDGNSGFKAEHTEWVSVSEPTQVQAMAEDMVNSFVGQTTQWKDIMLQCTGTGGGGKGGGFTQDTLPPEDVLPGLKLTGDFSYVDVGSPECSRTGKALISFKSNRPDNIHYSLDCTNGQHLSGYVKPEQVPQGGFVAAAMQSFQIDKTTVYSCALKTVQPGPVKLHQWKGHTFQCVTRTEGVTGTGGGGLSVGQDEPVLPERELTGDFSYVDVGSPKCSRAGKALISFKSNRADDVHYKLDCTNGQKFTGVAKMENNPQGGYVAAAMQTFEIEHTTVYSCALKTEQPGPAKLHEWKGHTFQCVTSTGVTGSDDLAPDTRPEPKKPDMPAIATEPKISCTDGEVKNGTCVCPNGYQRTTTGKNAWRCVKTAVVVPPQPKISCANGTVKNGTCVCPDGHQRTTTGKNAWRCVKTVVVVPPKPKISCANGTVKNGTCVCPSGHQRTTTGKNAWRCIKTAVVTPPKLPVGCVNGRVKNGTCVCPRGHTRTAIGKNAWRCVKASAPTQLAPRRSTR